MMEDEPGLSLDVGRLLETVLRLLPVVLLGTFVMANMLVIATRVLPQWQAYVRVQAEVDDANARLEAAASVEIDDASLLAAQVDEAGTGFATAANRLLTPTQPEKILENLYRYADESGTIITGILTQQSAIETDTDLYSVRMFRVHVLGYVPRLMNFIMRIQEARIPGIQIQNLSISQNEDTSDLTLDMLLYNSVYADGSVLANLPVLEIPTPYDPPQPGPVEPLVTITPTEPGSDLVLNTEATNAAADAGDSAVVCDTPSTLLGIGQVAVVDFNDDGALNVLSVPRTSTDPIELVGVVQDNDRLTILDGPVCGQWNGQAVWYWYVDHLGLRGWVGEASHADRWLCSEAEPECT